MTNDAPTPPKSSRRRYMVLIGLIVLVAAGWSGAWFYGRSVLAGQLDRQMNTMAQNGVDLSCRDLAIAGYPFRYEVSCLDMRSQDRAGAAASLGGLNAVALIYNPRHVIFEAKPPAAVEIPFQGLAGDITWETARASIKFTQSGLGELDAVIGGPEAAFENAVSTGRFAADKAEVHLRQAPDRPEALDSFVSINDLQLKSLPELHEAVSLRGHLRITDGTALLAGAHPASLVRMNEGALPVELVLLEASLGESRIGASGDLVLHGDGTLSGALDVTLGNADQLLQSLKPFFPPDDNRFALVKGVVDSLKPTATDMDGVQSIALTMTIDHGSVRVGFLPLGRIPPLFQTGT
ncbi:DUF2125 domain-containing protein [Roseibium salinum]|uniref:DUF2125 domain-containing protein n=1 Tax=Roseibium salinum TaxID=1604349 RepID=A0ABT3R6X8_9HYPH|nr:DUF2125 domain-containing protein [Roseibium sp. DSM 29163]MCX2724891.1 DUF2125 domain-containing protein [Roseibium sp. DSM 29163]MDN3721166.1 DUF2125 domain-containing protein [Roseibium salinum]